MKVKLDDVVYETHQALVTINGTTWKIPITHDKMRSEQNEEIENELTKIFSALKKLQSSAVKIGRCESKIKSLE